MIALLQVCVLLLIFVVSIWFSYMWYTTHDPNWGILLLLVVVSVKGAHS